MVRLFIVALLCAAFTLTACGSATHDERVSSKKGYDYYRAQSDLSSAGSPCTMRLTVTPDQPLPGQTVPYWDWELSNNARIISSSDDGSEIYVRMDHPGQCSYQARGVDRDGRDCTTPRGHFSSRRNYNAPPVVTDFGGPQLEGTHTDDTGRTFERWIWVDTATYDPEGDVIEGWEWGVYGGPDADGDGIGDELLAVRRFFSGHSYVPEQLQVEPISDPWDLYLQVNQRSGEVDQRARVTLTLTDAHGARRKWGDGHVTLMK